MAIKVIASQKEKYFTMWNRGAGKNTIWKQAPFLRLLFPFIAGILLENKYPVQAGLLILVFCLSLVLLIICFSISFSAFIGLEWVAGLVIHIAFFSMARILMHVHMDIQAEQSSCYVKGQPNLLLVRLLGDPVQKPNSYKCFALVKWLTKDHTCFNENERIFVYFAKKPDPRQYSGGSLIIFRKELRPIENFKSTSDFDYKKYCHLRHIYSQVFLKENEYSLIHIKKEKSFFYILDSLRENLRIIIKKYIPGKSENSLLEALMVGFNDDLDPGLLKSYANTGVIHIIAISGLHLTLICHILELSLQKTGRKKFSRWIKLILIITSLWAYSVLSGASPSVIRAATMFSLVLISRNILRESVFINTLAASAFLLLCFEPNWIWDIGFQLSYVAVLSLSLFSKPLNEMLPLHNKILVSVWKAASVSLAAQVLTTPISIYYFHQFPSYFLVANLLAVPLSSGILIGGILLCIFSSIQSLCQFLGWLLGIMIHFLNGFIFYISMLPGAVISHITLTLPQLILIYFILLCFYRYLISKQKNWLLTGMGSICLFQVIRLFA
ncbi:MAG TPA: ComEC/Rec2 family competence protein [Puia sp.]|nr:ComEC/Rec2 family competence protein [Puia sp.]